jgi:co-chaperonin GroES (HSP10)|tara:strand:+ start:310 stop:642 length:333 start_codon:yes stop_codon:yes gene_type:complete
MSKELPKPQGYRMLLKPWEPLEKSAGGVILSEQTRDMIRFACVVSEVIEMGPECYKDMSKSNTTWCKPGDYVLTGKYVGLKFKYENADYSIINDDEVVAVVPNPDKIKHR